MKHLLLLPLVIFLAACSPDTEYALSSKLPESKQTLAHKAYFWYGLSEENNRQTLKDITGVDPVTTEWCAAFVNMVLLENELPTSESVSAFPLMARSFITYGQEVTTPEKGDILVFERGEAGWQGHVGFYVSQTKDMSTGKIWYNVIGGNQNDSVSIQRYPADKLITIRRVSL